MDQLNSSKPTHARQPLQKLSRGNCSGIPQHLVTDNADYIHCLLAVCSKVKIVNDAVCILQQTSKQTPRPVLPAKITLFHELLVHDWLCLSAWQANTQNDLQFDAKLTPWVAHHCLCLYSVMQANNQHMSSTCIYSTNHSQSASFVRHVQTCIIPYHVDSASCHKKQPQLIFGPLLPSLYKQLPFYPGQWLLQWN